MAEHFVNIYGTEKDKVNCPFYYKIGACRHGDRCSRVHNKPLFSQTIMLQNLYHSPEQIEEYARQQGLPPPRIPEEDRRHHFDDFYDDIRTEMEKYGRVESVNVCENLAEHLAGNCYVRFRDEQAAAAALRAVQGRLYAGVQVKAEFSPVTDFREGKCRPFERGGNCEYGDFCHFMHLRRHPRNLERTHHERDDAYRRPNRKSDERRYRARYDRDRTYDYRRDSERDGPSPQDSAARRDRSYPRDEFRSERRYSSGSAAGGGRRYDRRDRDRDRDRDEYDRDDYRRTSGGDRRHHGSRSDARRDYS